MKLINIIKEQEHKIYVKQGQEVPKGKKLQTGPRGGKYFMGSAEEKEKYQKVETSQTTKLPSKIKKYFPESSEDVNNGFFVLRLAVNNELRTGNKSNYREKTYADWFKKQGLDIDEMKQALEDATTKHADTLDKNTTMYRGVPANFAKKLKDGKIIKDAGFSYLSTDEDMAKQYSGRKGAVIKISAKKGLKGKWGMKDQSEFILPKDSKIKITSVKDNIINAEII